MNFDYLIERRDHVLALAWEHVQLSALAVALALVVALPLGMVAARFRGLTLPILGALGVIYTVPSLAFLAFLIPSLGIGRDNALVVLAAYAQIFLVRNIVAGLRGVDPRALEAGQGLGMTPAQVFWQVRWPLALPVIIAGIRTALVTTISLASIAAWINAGGLGQLLFEGLARFYWSEVLAGAIAIVALTVLADAALRLVERATAVSRARRAVR
jgi:osmoprotectant transport system permease protein